MVSFRRRHKLILILAPWCWITFIKFHGLGTDIQETRRHNRNYFDFISIAFALHCTHFTRYSRGRGRRSRNLSGTHFANTLFRTSSSHSTHSTAQNKKNKHSIYQPISGDTARNHLICRLLPNAHRTPATLNLITAWRIPLTLHCTGSVSKYSGWLAKRRTTKPQQDVIFMLHYNVHLSPFSDCE